MSEPCSHDPALGRCASFAELLCALQELLGDQVIVTVSPAGRDQIPLTTATGRLLAVLPIGASVEDPVAVAVGGAAYRLAPEEVRTAWRWPRGAERIRGFGALLASGIQVEFWALEDFD